MTLPHGYGTIHRKPDGSTEVHGPNVNDLTSADHRDPITATPYRKRVPVRVTAAPAS